MTSEVFQPNNMYQFKKVTQASLHDCPQCQKYTLCESMHAITLSPILQVSQLFTAARVFQANACFCGEGDIHTQVSSTHCYDEHAFRCTGNREQICGGQLALSVYTGMMAFQICNAWVWLYEYHFCITIR